MMVRFDNAWGRLGHSSYPEILTGSVQKTIKKEINRANKSADYEMVNLCKQATSAANKLAEIMNTGYKTRVIADYEPDILVDFEGPGRFKLQGVDITEAHHWPETAENLTTIIDRAWKQIHA